MFLFCFEACGRTRMQLVVVVIPEGVSSESLLRQTDHGTFSHGNQNRREKPRQPVTRQMIFNGQGLRFDGNFDLPTRVAKFQARLAEARHL